MSLALARPAATKIRMLALKQITLDPATQMRAAFDHTVITEYSEIIERLPPIVCFWSGKNYYLADGWHRVKAAMLARKETIACKVREGTLRDAILYAAGSNAEHGLRRTPNDKRRAVMTLLEDAEWASWSTREIARQCAVSAAFVTVLRQQIEGPEPDPQRRRLAVRNGKLISRPAEHHKPPSSNGHANGHAVELVRCPKCGHAFAPPHALDK
jgi:hypothetical protein